MSNKTLNVIIAISVIGISAVFIFDLIFKKGDVVVQTTPPPVENDLELPVQKTDPLVECDSRFLDLSNESEWTYEVTTKSNLPTPSSAPSESKPSTILITSRINSINNSIIAIDSVFGDSEEILTSTITCKESGIHGVPFPITSLLKQHVNIPGLDLIGNIEDEFILFPKFDTVGTSWNSGFGLGENIPFISDIAKISIKHEVVTKQNKTILSIPNVETISIVAALEDGDLPIDISKQVKIDYELAQNIGVTSFHVMADGSTIGKAEVSIKLVEFSN